MQFTSNKPPEWKALQLCHSDGRLRWSECVFLITCSKKVACSFPPHCLHRSGHSGWDGRFYRPNTSMSPVENISFSKNPIGDFVSFKQNIQLSIFSSQKALSQDLIVYCFHRSHTLTYAGLELSFIHYTNRRANGADNLLNFEPLLYAIQGIQSCGTLEAGSRADFPLHGSWGRKAEAVFSDSEA